MVQCPELGRRYVSGVLPMCWSSSIGPSERLIPQVWDTQSTHGTHYRDLLLLPTDLESLSPGDRVDLFTDLESLSPGDRVDLFTEYLSLQWVQYSYL